MGWYLKWCVGCSTTQTAEMCPAGLCSLKTWAANGFTLPPLLSRNKPTAVLRWCEYCCGHFPPQVCCLCASVWLGGKLNVIAGPAGAVDLGGLPSGNGSASCIDFYFHGWVIWVSALESQLGCHQGQLGRQGICFCLHQFHTVSRYRCAVWIFFICLLRLPLPRQVLGCWWD